MMTSKRSDVMAAVMSISAIAFSICLAHYYNTVTSSIMQLEPGDISSNTVTEANMISQIFIKSLDSVVDNLRIISNTSSTQDGSSSGKVSPTFSSKKMI